MNKQIRDKENKPLIDNARFKRIGTTDRTASPINQILSKMRKQQSPHLSARTPKECQSRISNDCEQQLQFDAILEMEERKRKIRKFKQCLTENIEKLKEFDAITQQLLCFEDCLTQILKNIKQIKSEISEQIKQQQINQKINIHQIKESIKQMSEDISLNEFNIIKEMQMKPFNNIMSHYMNKCEGHLDKIENMISTAKSQLEFKEMCRQIEQKLLTLRNQSPHFKEV
ncbi:unnamed protein product (macronuclear) [Paramecium tetraurelia]|uniref:Uncharacterized protein n=1 Tax=Paramecium tetraurelia TaxID=5888 RepID=A0EH86_PARTE|nr:uncharacterized protein GSPATT00027001001 [Paramecium tetraurelia]CAK94677.1 unnamed protein product [Paramecium tetraurelia]|eukprot:XP_001462050.1 hypothetical protein (macronuclear) [Paramecium tetraurelia strain d4-2]